MEKDTRHAEGLEPPAAEHGEAAYRGFLFADLRGYTSYIEHAGNAAGVQLLDEYLAITRAAVAEHDGAEIKVEGDGFHAVFPSASSAVMCGLAIVQAAEDASKGPPGPSDPRGRGCPCR